MKIENFDELHFCLNLELFAKIKKTWYLHAYRNHAFYNFILIQDLKEDEKIPNTLS